MLLEVRVLCIALLKTNLSFCGSNVFVYALVTHFGTYEKHEIFIFMCKHSDFYLI